MRKEEAGGQKASRAGGTRHMAARARFANHVPICGPPPSTTGSEVNCIGIRGFRFARVIVHFHHALFPCLGYSIAVLDFSLVFICGWCGSSPQTVFTAHRPSQALDWNRNNLDIRRPCNPRPSYPLHQGHHHHYHHLKDDARAESQSRRNIARSWLPASVTRSRSLRCRCQQDRGTHQQLASTVAQLDRQQPFKSRSFQSFAQRKQQPSFLIKLCRPLKRWRRLLLSSQ